MKVAWFPLVLALAACGSNVPPTAAENPAETSVRDQATAPAAKAFSNDEESSLIDFHFGWSAEAAAVPGLVERFRSEMAREKAELIAGAREDKAWRNKDGLEFHAFSSSVDYSTAGQSQRLLSLSMDVGSYTGGAHGNSGTSSLLWDRSRKKEIAFEELFASAANSERLLTQRWCEALNVEREERRGSPVTGDEMFDDCPKLGDIAIAPTDKDGNGRFERLLLTAAPYVAGPYAEGAYEVELFVTPDLMAALKDEYRASFEVQPQ